jgi:hypothetical protein
VLAFSDEEVATAVTVLNRRGGSAPAVNHQFAEHFPTDHVRIDRFDTAGQ